jgi:hypothetical protein
MRLSLKKNLLIIILCIGFIFINKTADALFEVEVDAYSIDFGFMNISESKELQDKGLYHNEVSCKSDNARAWYLKIQSMGPLKSGDDYIPYENFSWKAVEALNGDGVIYNKDAYNSFYDIPALVYSSGVNDSKGSEVSLRFKYNLFIPKNQIAGNYRTIIRYTMTEMP